MASALAMRRMLWRENADLLIREEAAEAEAKAALLKETAPDTDDEETAAP